MPKYYITIVLAFASTCAVGQVQNATVSTSPETFNEDESVTLTFSGINTSLWGVNDLYLWAWYFKNEIETVVLMLVMGMGVIQTKHLNSPIMVMAHTVLHQRHKHFLTILASLKWGVGKS